MKRYCTIAFSLLVMIVAGCAAKPLEIDGLFSIGQSREDVESIAAGFRDYSEIAEDNMIAFTMDEHIYKHESVLTSIVFDRGKVESVIYLYEDDYYDSISRQITEVNGEPTRTGQEMSEWERDAEYLTVYGYGGLTAVAITTNAEEIEMLKANFESESDE